VLALELARTFSVKDKQLHGILDQLKGLDGSGHWAFLQTHGMWTCGLRREGGLTLEVDLEGERTLHLHSYKDYELIRAIENVPLFHFMVEKLAVHKDSKKDSEEASDVSPWGIHIRMKRAELATPPSQSIKVSPLTFFAATVGFHRLARSFRLQAIQSALSKEIAKALFGANAEALGYKAFHDLYGVGDRKVDDRDEVLGAFVALASGNVRTSKIPLKAVEAELTTAREPIRHVRIYKCLLEHLVKSKKLNVGVRQSDGGLQLYSKEGDEEGDHEELNDMLRIISRDVLGRLEAYRRVLEELKNKSFDGEVHVAIGFSEQMGPCDLYLLASLLKGLSVETTYVLATPLSYPMAAISSLYAALELEGSKALGRVKFVLASEDVAVSKSLAKYLAEGTEGKVLVYLASGPTPQVLTLCVELKRLKRGKALLIPLAPLPATAREATPRS